MLSFIRRKELLLSLHILLKWNQKTIKLEMYLNLLRHIINNYKKIYVQRLINLIYRCKLNIENKKVKNKLEKFEKEKQEFVKEKKELLRNYSEMTKIIKKKNK